MLDPIVVVGEDHGLRVIQYCTGELHRQVLFCCDSVALILPKRLWVGPGTRMAESSGFFAAHDPGQFVFRDIVDVGFLEKVQELITI